MRLSLATITLGLGLATFGCATSNCLAGLPGIDLASVLPVDALDISWRPDGPRYFVIRSGDELAAFTAEVEAHRPPPELGLTATVRAVGVFLTGGLFDIIVDAGPNQVIQAAATTTLKGAVRGGIEPLAFEWTGVDLTNGAAVVPDDPNARQPTVSPSGDTLYTLTVTDAAGRVRQDSATVFTVDFASETLIAFSVCQSSVIADAVLLEGSTITVRLCRDPSFVGIPCIPVPVFRTRVLRVPAGLPVRIFDDTGELVLEAG